MYAHHVGALKESFPWVSSPGSSLIGRFGGNTSLAWLLLYSFDPKTKSQASMTNPHAHLQGPAPNAKWFGIGTTEHGRVRAKWKAMKSWENELKPGSVENRT